MSTKTSKDNLIFALKDDFKTNRFSLLVLILSAILLLWILDMTLEYRAEVVNKSSIIDISIVALVLYCTWLIPGEVTRYLMARPFSITSHHLKIGDEQIDISEISQISINFILGRYSLLLEMKDDRFDDIEIILLYERWTLLKKPEGSQVLYEFINEIFLENRLILDKVSIENKEGFKSRYEQHINKFESRFGVLFIILQTIIRR